MNPMLLLTATPKTPLQGVGTTSKATPEQMEGGATSFVELLGGLLQEDGPKLSIESEVDFQGIEALFKQLQLANVTISEEALEENEEIATLLSLMPEEWQEEIIALSQQGEVDFQSKSDVENLLIALIALESSKDHPSYSQLMKQLERYAERVIPTLMRANEEQHLLQRITNQLNELLKQQPKSRENRELFLTLLTKKEQNPLPFLRSAYVPITTDQSTNVQHGLQPIQGHEFGQVMTRAEQATIQLGEHLPRAVQEQQFVRQFQHILQRAVFTQQQGVNTLSIKLYPEHLGRLDVQLIQQEGMIVAKLLTSSTVAKELIESQLAHLRQAFIQQQIPVERIEVAEQFVRKDGENETDQQRGQQEQRQQKQNEEERSSFNEFLEQWSFDEEV